MKNYITCGKCRKTSMEVDFSPSASERAGRYCKCCQAEYYIEYKKTKEGKAAAKRAVDKYIGANPKKNTAHGKVKTAIKNGELERPESCTHCGAHSNDVGTIQAHHTSYEREHWLDVVFVCPPCHYDVHQGKIPSIPVPN